MESLILKRVERRTQNDLEMSGSSRLGTVWASLESLISALGEPYYYDDPEGDSKVKIGWQFKTPRGNVEVRDYWWNRKGEWSLAASNKKQLLWIKGFLRAKGLRNFNKEFEA